ncbi:hypothetical protein PV04_07306 [Phialophora macrospora]|uniref:DUF7729 domain-containing protein n=1 Tax=Phialophora macrospora TaxID=1851006 RepID=A0A0D2FYS3_9EURO|nr:hypothetical protein PV04_07306 [Phialophora macrospora]
MRRSRPPSRRCIIPMPTTTTTTTTATTTPMKRISIPTSMFKMITIMLLLLCTLQPTGAQIMEFDPQIYESPFFQQLAIKGEIHIDRGQPPPRHDIYQDLAKRQVDDSGSDGDGDSVVPTTIAESTSTSTPSSEPTTTTLSSEETTPSTQATMTTETETPKSTSSVSTSTAPSVSVITTPLPTPFDTSLGSNFTGSSCPQFFSAFLANATFNACVPVSLLLQNSNSFFRAQRSFTLLTQTLDTACNAPLAICSPLMANLATQLIDDANCGQDYRQQNPLVVQAYAGLVAYEPVYRATCLRDENGDTSSNSYCFVEAVTNTNTNSDGDSTSSSNSTSSSSTGNSADFYPYYTAIGLSMPQTASPSCTQCLKETMRIFASYAENAVQPLAKTYLPCAVQVDKTCGSVFVSTDVKVGSVASPNAAAGGAGAYIPRVSSLVVSVGLIALAVGLS